MSDLRDQWSAGSTYEAFMGRWSRRMAPLFVSWLRLPRGLHWLDVGCGTGACTEAILAHAEPASVTGCDPALPFVDFAREHQAKPPWMPAVANCTARAWAVRGTA